MGLRQIDEHANLIDDYGFLVDLLNMLSCLTRVAISLKVEDEIVSSERRWSGYCKFIKTLNLGICEKGFDGTKEIHMCDAGLYCYSLPVSIEDKNIGFIALGHCMLEGHEEDSKKMLKKLAESRKLDEKIYSDLKDLLGQVDIIKEPELLAVIDRHLQSIEKYLNLEWHHQKRIRELKTLSTYLAHSFLIPIQAVVSKTDNLLSRLNEMDKRYCEPELIENCNGILNETIKLSYSAENLRDWMAEEKDIYRFDTKEKVNLHGIIRDAIELYRSEAFERGILLNDPVPRDIPFPTIKGSAPHLRKVFINLMNNAVKYSFDGYPGHFRFVDTICRPSGKYYCVEISNLGIGIMPDEIEKVFEYGYRGKMARDRNRFGSGLGLPTVKRIVEKHDGKVEAESKIVGSYDGSKRNPYKTTLRVFLPQD